MINDLMNPIDEEKVDFEQDKKIDLHNLHNDWLTIAAKIGKYNKLLTQAETDRDKAKEFLELKKENLGVAKAKLDIAIRKEPNNYGLAEKMKTSETWFSNTVNIYLNQDAECISTTKELSEAKEKLIEANYKVGIYQSAVKTMSAIKDALEHLVFLWSRGYFNVPNIPRPLLDDYKNTKTKIQDDVVSKVREKIQPSETKDKDLDNGLDIEPTSSPRRRRGL
jgi:hypothetical protein